MSRNGFWDCCWGNTDQLLASFSPVASNRSCPRSLCKHYLDLVSLSSQKWWNAISSFFKVVNMLRTRLRQEASPPKCLHNWWARHLNLMDFYSLMWKNRIHLKRADSWRTMPKFACAWTRKLARDTRPSLPPPRWSLARNKASWDSSFMKGKWRQVVQWMCPKAGEFYSFLRIDCLFIVLISFYNQRKSLFVPLEEEFDSIRVQIIG